MVTGPSSRVAPRLDNEPRGVHIMAINQDKLHELGRSGEAIVADAVNGETTNHKAPFDIVDFSMGVAYEVKTMSAASKDLKIHISEKSMSRKQAFANEYKLTTVLIAVVVFTPAHVQVYTSPLVNGIRVSHMTLVADSADGPIADNMRDYWKARADGQEGAD